MDSTEQPDDAAEPAPEHHFPSARKFLQWIREPWTFRQIEAEVARRMGVELGTLNMGERILFEHSIDRAIGDAFGPATQDHRYFDCVPWRVQPVHARAYPPRVLRLLGLRRIGRPLAPSSDSELTTFLRLLDRAGLVVAYCPVDEEGFVLVPAAWRSGPNEDIPICVPALSMDEVDWIREHHH